jgi:hypothetical protein
MKRFNNRVFICSAQYFYGVTILYVPYMFNDMKNNKTFSICLFCKVIDYYSNVYNYFLFVYCLSMVEARQCILFNTASSAAPQILLQATGRIAPRTVASTQYIYF